MELRIRVRDVEWWLWAITLTLIVAALAGWSSGYLAVMVASAVQVVWFARATGSATSFPTQVRVAYLAVTLLALWAPARLWVLLALALGTTMVVLLDRCAIALVLAKMPWNARVAPRCDLPPARTASRPAGAGAR